MPPVRRATRKVRMNVKKGLEKDGSDKSTPKSRSKPKSLPLVEHTNALSLEEFKSLYIPSSELHFQRESRTTKAREIDKSPADTPAPKFNTYTISIYSSSTIPDGDLESCLDLISLTSSAAYKASSGGWSPTEKRKEMKLPEMKYMILRRGAESHTPDGDSEGNNGSEDDGEEDETGDFAGFLEFMVTYEDGYEVLYCYEIHLTPEAQGQGLGEELTSRFERIGQRIGLEKTMLTVFKSNSRAVAFYERVGFTEDENSPRPRRLRNGTVKEVDYMIMSKNLR
ncbi:acyl-CoA N-acyltransferase [Aspergillus spectabilis]